MQLDWKKWPLLLSLDGLGVMAEDTQLGKNPSKPH